MRIQCPSCSAAYHVPDALLDPPRTVRCAKCARDWMAISVPEEPDFEHLVNDGNETIDFDPEPAEADISFHEEPGHPFDSPHAMIEEPHVVAPTTSLNALTRVSVPVTPSGGRGRDKMLAAAWAGSFAALAVLGMAGYTKRDQLMLHWPASKRVYAMLGLVHGEDKVDADKPGR